MQLSFRPVTFSSGRPALEGLRPVRLRFFLALFSRARVFCVVHGFEVVCGGGNFACEHNYGLNCVF